MTDFRCDVAVVGAGAAGLAAAGDLSRAGRSVVVLEARDRIGGRVHTLHDAAHPLAVELGAEFVDVPGPDWDALRAAGGAAIRSVGGMWEVDGGLARRADWERTIGPVMERLNPPPVRDASFADFLRDRCAGLDADVRASAVRYVEGFHAARADRVGVHWLAAAAEGGGGGGGDERFHPLPGFDAVIEGLRRALAAGVEVRTSCAVTEIGWSPGEVRVQTARGVVRARGAVVTLPLGILQLAPHEPGAVRFTPALPEVAEAARALEMGHVVKVTMRFREAFWDGALRFGEGEPGTKEVKFLMSDEAFPTFWTPSPVVAPVLTAWAGGTAAERVIAGGDPVAAAVDAVARATGVERARVEALLERAYHHDWDADPYSRGAYSYVPVGGMEAQARLRRPVRGTVFFAGEATAGGGNNATVAGAIESGRRAAREVIEPAGG